jgi:hypothetical protein
MKKTTEKVDPYRIKVEKFASDESYGMNGVFKIPGPRGIYLLCIVSNGGGWDHVSVERFTEKRSERVKVPYWNEMCFIKDLFWDSEEVVIQYHPAKSTYVNVSEGVLHLWKPQNATIPTPPITFV